jgi:hypothetical protein
MPTSLYKIIGDGKQSLCRLTLRKEKNKNFVWNPRNWYMGSVAEPQGTRFIADSGVSLKRLREMSSKSRIFTSLCNNNFNVGKNVCPFLRLILIIESGRNRVLDCCETLCCL